jgi:hypothetical protein
MSGSWQPLRVTNNARIARSTKSNTRKIALSFLDFGTRFAQIKIHPHQINCGLAVSGKWMNGGSVPDFNGLLADHYHGILYKAFQSP